MKISELLEARTPKSQEPATESPPEKPTPVTIAVTDRFVRDFSDFSTMPKFVEDFETFIKSKFANPQAAWGKKDTVWSSGKMVPKLKGWSHAHIIFGKAIVIYRVVNNKIFLAAITDHLSVEGEGPRIRNLGEYVDSIDLGLAYKPQDKERKTTTANPITLPDLEKKLGIAKDQEPSAEQLAQQALQKSVLALFYEMAAVPQDRALLMSLVKQGDTSVLFFFDVMNPPIPQDAVSLEDLKQLAKRALAAIPG